MRESDPLPRRYGRVFPALALLLVFSAILRLWSASDGLHGGRFFDERFSVRNVATLLEEGSLRPSNAFYTRLSYLPHTGLLALSEGFSRLSGLGGFSVFDDGSADGYSATAYLICRAVSVAAGVWSLWLLFGLGKRLFDERVGLMAALFLSATWAHVQTSSLFKPDILVVVFTLLAIRWALDAVEKPTLGRFLLAGVGVGLATSAKYTGVGVATALTAGVVFGGWKDRRQWLGLVLAGLASALTFVALNCHLDLVWRDYQQLQLVYSSNAEVDGTGHLTVLAEEFFFLLRHHGWLVTLLALLGLAGFFWRLRQGAGGPSRLQTAVLLGYALGWSVLYAMLTTLFRSQNYLPVLACTSLAAAWVLVGIWDRLTSRVVFLGRPVVAGLLVFILSLFVLYQPVTLAYQDVVPSTTELIASYLTRKLQPGQYHYLYCEEAGQRINPHRGGHRLPAVPVEDLARLAPAELHAADGFMFPAAKLDGSDAKFYLEEAAARTGRGIRVGPEPFKAHGAPLMLLLNDWQMADEPESLSYRAAARSFPEASVSVALDAPLEIGEAISLAIWLPYLKPQKKPLAVEIQGQRVRLFRTRIEGKRAHYLSQRIAIDQLSDELTIKLPLEVARFPALPNLEAESAENIRLIEQEWYAARLLRWRSATGSS